jgi:hypothetical protein
MQQPMDPSPQRTPQATAGTTAPAWCWRLCPTQVYDPLALKWTGWAHTRHRKICLGYKGHSTMPSSMWSAVCPDSVTVQGWALSYNATAHLVSMPGHFLLVVVHSMHYTMNFGWFTTLSTREQNGSLVVLSGQLLYLECWHLNVPQCCHLLYRTIPLHSLWSAAAVSCTRTHDHLWFYK